jgi:hypothetical protein
MNRPTPSSRRSALAAVAGLAVLAGALALPLAAQAQRVTGSGTAATEQRQLPPFQAVALSGSMDLLVRQGSSQVVEVTADDNLLALLETEVRGSGDDARLEVRWKRGSSINTRTPTRLSITVPRLSALSASGSGDMTVERFETPALAIRVSGSSDTFLRGLVTAQLDIAISGSGDVEGSGSATRVGVKVSGSGDIDLEALKADDVAVTISGSGDAAVHADKSLEVRIAGSGDVRYRGDPAKVNAKVAGSGSVSKR